MIIKRPGSEFTYEGVTYAVGDVIIGTNESEYEGLYGSILEIRDGEDKETENETPDIYCSFEEPARPSEVKKLESIFSDLYDEPKTIEDICLDEVIMAPSMIRVLSGVADEPIIKIYKVVEDWAIAGESDDEETLFTDLDSAKLFFHRKLSNEVYGGCVDLWRDKAGFVEEEDDRRYAAYVDGDYCDCHYVISLLEAELHIGAAQLRTLGSAYNAEIRRQHFIAASQQEEGVETLMEAQYKQMLHDPEIPAMIQAELDANEFYHEEYWRAVTNTVATLSSKYARVQKDAGKHEGEQP